jgi:hypothetical protein
MGWRTKQWTTAGSRTCSSIFQPRDSSSLQRRMEIMAAVATSAAEPCDEKVHRRLGDGNAFQNVPMCSHHMR